MYYVLLSPSGKLVQIEYALAAVAAGGPSVGIKGLCQFKSRFSKGHWFIDHYFFIIASNGVVLAAEKKQKSILHDDATIHKVF